MGEINEETTYSIRDVEQFLTEIQQDYERQLDAKEEIINNLKKQNQEMQQILAKHIENEQQLSNALRSAEQKSHSVEASIRNVYELKTRQMVLLYKKLEKDLNELQNRYRNFISVDEINHLTSDFQVALTMTIDNKENNEIGKAKEENRQANSDGYQTFRAKNIGLHQVSHKAKQVMGKSVENKLFDNFMGNKDEAGTVLQSTAEQFLSRPVDGNISLKSMGKNRMNNIIPRDINVTPKRKEGFSLEEALVPNQTLEEIMLAFDIEK